MWLKLIISMLILSSVILAGVMGYVHANAIKCTDEAIKDKILSLSHDYSPEEIEEMIPKIKLVECGNAYN